MRAAELEERPLELALPPWAVETQQEHGPELERLPSGPAAPQYVFGLFLAAGLELVRH